MCGMVSEPTMPHIRVRSAFCLPLAKMEWFHSLAEAHGRYCLCQPRSQPKATRYVTQQCVDKWPARAPIHSLLGSDSYLRGRNVERSAPDAPLQYLCRDPVSRFLPSADRVATREAIRWPYEGPQMLEQAGERVDVPVLVLSYTIQLLSLPLLENRAPRSLINGPPPLLTSVDLPEPEVPYWLDFHRYLQYARQTYTWAVERFHAFVVLLDWMHQPCLDVALAP